MRVRTRLAVALLVCALAPIAMVAAFVRPMVSHAIEPSPATPRDAASERPVDSSRASRDLARRAALADLDRLLVIAAIAAVALAIIFALLLAPPLARPIQAVTDAADRIAHGTRSVRIGNTTAAGEAGKLVRAFNEMARELESAEARLRRVERVAAWRDIARQMAHEIKNPLTPIQMAVEMLRKARERELPDFDALFDEQTRIVLEEVARLRRLVENFSRFARAPKPQLETVSVTDVVSHVVGLHAAAGGAEVTGEAEETLPAIRADREQLTQVLVNLVANACLAAEDRSRAALDKGPAAVHVSARSLGNGRVAIDVDDNGAGIDTGVMERLFEPYVTTRQGKGGTGLGLAIAFRIVTDHGGTIAADTSPEGTRFEVVLPIAGPSASDITLDSEDKKLPSLVGR
jgi:nitrogen fixation/metabolism regulation signal transduction histidine kinase